MALYQSFLLLSLQLLLLLILPRLTSGLASTNTKNSFEKTLSNIQKKIIKPPKLPEQTVLERINLQSNTEPKTFQFQLQQLPDLITASFPALFRLGTGMFADGYSVSLGPFDPNRYTVAAFGNSSQIREFSTTLKYSKQNLPLILYEFEGCPFCRKVREAVSILSLEVTFRPCPQGERTFRNQIKEKYGDNARFPYLEDPNTGVQMFESDDIISYLFSVYGTSKSKIPWTLKPNNPLVPLSAGLGLLPRLLLGRGSSYRPSNVPPEPLKLWMYEGSPFCKIVRERLVELGLPHTQVACPRGSFQRDNLRDKVGKFQVPYLEDPNTNVQLFESAAIIEYVEKVYGLKEPSVKYL